MTQKDQQLASVGHFFAEGLSANSHPEDDDSLCPSLKTDLRAPSLSITLISLHPRHHQIRSRKANTDSKARFYRGSGDSPTRKIWIAWVARPSVTRHCSVGGGRWNRLLRWRRFVHSGATRAVRPAQIDFRIGVGRSLDRGPGQALTGAATAAPGGALRPLFWGPALLGPSHTSPPSIDQRSRLQSIEQCWVFTAPGPSADSR